MKKKLYVGSLPFSVNDSELANIFSAHGTVTSARVVIDRVSGRSKGFGFVEYEAEDSAQKAIEALNDAEISGRKIVVNEAREQAPRSGGGGGRGFGGGRSGHRGGGGGGRGFGGGGGRDRGDRGGYGGDRY